MVSHTQLARLAVWNIMVGRGNIAPQPAQRVGQDGAAVFARVAAVAEFESIVVAGVLERRGHFLIGQRPVYEKVVQVVGAILKKHTDGFAIVFEQQSGIAITPLELYTSTNLDT